nr:hypothetical protein [Deltaproteobacteria bacterium]
MTSLRFVCLVVIAACSGSSSPPTSSRTTGFVQVQGVHGQAIDVLAVSEDGGVAVTADRQGGLRLWPALDGSREPVVIAGGETHALAIVRDGQDVAIAALDPARHVAISRWSLRGGEPGPRRQLEHPVRLLAATRAHFLVVTDDHAIDLHDARGERRAHLVAEPGTRIESLVVRGERALAVLASRDRVHGRWIDLAANAWGTSTGTLALAASPVVLSPDGHTLAGIDPKTALPLVMDSATGKVTRSPVCDARPATATLDVTTAIVPIGFHDARTLVCASVAGLQWWSLEGAVLRGDAPFAMDAAVAFGAGRAIVAHDTQLALVDATGIAYLGYETTEFPHVRFTPRGVLVGRGDQHATLLDDDFQTRLDIALPPIAGTWYDVLPLDDRYLLTLSSNGELGAAHAKRVAIYDRETRALGPLLPFEGTDEQLTYEPAT